jgi:site-specific DNA-methyltransferase (adenine-specific)
MRLKMFLAPCNAAVPCLFWASRSASCCAFWLAGVIELHRVLKPTGVIYLHCDPTASHYLKIVLDRIFGATNFCNEIIWKRTSAHSDAKRYASVHDTLLFYRKGPEWTWHQQYEPYSDEYIATHFVHSDPDGRLFRRVDLRSPSPRPNLTYDYKASNGITYKPHANGWAVSREKMAELDANGRLFFPKKEDARLRRKLYLEDSPGVAISDTWTDIKPIFATNDERLGYPTQKPLALLERIISASSDPGMIVLDPFCGCGTAIEAAQKLGRRWIGIDVTYLAIHVIETRLVEAFGESIKRDYMLFGQPEDADDARALAARDWLEFQKWAVMKVGGLPLDRAGPDGGIDGIIRYHRVGIEQPNRAVVSVKGGQNVGVDAIHKLKSVVDRERAELGVLICLDRPTSAMEREVAHSGDVGPKSKRVSKLQIITVDMLFLPNAVDLPGMIDLPEAGKPLVSSRQKGRKKIEGQTEMLFPIKGENETKRRGNRPIRIVDIEVTRASKRKKGE